jgi:dihydroxyacetone kinase DhaKLM complex PTS-EIIA-like component DhaM
MSPPSPSYDSDSADPLLENALQIIILSAAQKLGEGFKKIVAFLAFESIEPLFTSGNKKKSLGAKSGEHGG